MLFRAWCTIIGAMSRFYATDACQCRETVAQMGKDGWLTLSWPKEFGGQDRPPMDGLIFNDEASITRAYEAGATDFQAKSGTEWALLSERLRYMVRSSRLREELAESSARLSKAQRIARLGNWDWNVAARTVTLSREGFAIAGLPQTAHRDALEAIADFVTQREF